MASYTSPDISGYNSNPPSDDGSETTTNRIDWSTIKNKLNDPTKTYAEAIDSATTSAFSTIDGQIADGSAWYKADTGAADAYVVTLSPAVSSNVVGRKTSFKAANANTGASTLNINGIGAEAIKRQNGSALSGNDILASSIYTVVWDGTNYILQTQATQGVFVNNANDNPNISDTVYDLSSHPFTSWSDIGDTTSGATNTWAALDSVPAGANWIEVGVNVHASMNSGATTILSLLIYARANGGTQGAGQDNIIIDERQDIVNNTVALALYSFTTVKIPVNTTTGMFDLIQTKAGTFSSSTSALILKGYGWN
jgi:hypothetical protein